MVKTIFNKEISETVVKAVHRILSFKCIVFLSLSLLLSACQTVVVAPDGETRLQKFDSEAYTQRYQQRKSLEDKWLVEGKFSFSSPKESGQGRFKWSKDNSAEVSDQLRLFGPFGAGMVKMEVFAGGARIDNGKSSLSANNIEQLSLDVLGWLLPYTELKYWLFALPIESSTAWVSFDDKNNVSVMQQSGWDIKFSGEKMLVLDNGEKVRLPKKISAFHSETSSKVKLVVSSAIFPN